jgi:hypothetical protein
MGGIVALTFASTAHAGADDVVRSVDRPFAKRPQAAVLSGQFKPAPPALIAPVAPATAVQSQIQRPREWQRWSLMVSDSTIERVFERWARERKVTLRWLVGRDLPIDAAAETIVPDVRDFDQAAAEGSADPEMAAAMMKVARAFKNSKAPFVVREYDNAFLVMPKSETRP